MSNGKIEVRVNGERRAMQNGATVRTLIEELGFGQKRVAVEINLEVVPRSRHAEHLLADGDVIEVVSFVGGG
jgi:sulfur carrier protein